MTLDIYENKYPLTNNNAPEMAIAKIAKIFFTINYIDNNLVILHLVIFLK
ncbi:MAG: hypothetical protein AAGF83_19350 [Cyanobacteria bacterium P01_G01_bin.67]